LAALTGTLKLGFALLDPLSKIGNTHQVRGAGYPKNYIALVHKAQPEPSA
jgi:hypothetical protein